MKTCSYCGRGNQDTAMHCQECGQELTAPPASAKAPGRWEKITILRNEAEAERLDVELERLNVPHMLVSYRDSAFDGIYQTPKGWGHVEAPDEQKAAILSVLEDLRQSSSSDSQPETPLEPD